MTLQQCPILRNIEEGIATNVQDYRNCYIHVTKIIIHREISYYVN